MSSSQEQQERSFRRLVAANILTKVAMYCLAFGLLLLCTGGIRSCFLPASSSSQLLIIIGIVAALLGVVHTIIAIFVIGGVGLLLEYALIRIATAFTFEEVKS